MRFYEFLIEHNRNIMLKQTSPKILDAVKNDTSAALPQNLLDIQTMLVYSNKNGDKILDDKITNLIEIEVAAIEEKDPTPNKQYVPWLVRMYSKGGVKYEDLNRHNMIGMHVEAKRRNMLRPEYKDINRFKTYQEFEDVMFSNYDPDEVFGNEEDETEKPQAKKVFENEQVLIVVPENEAAACKYGKNTRWGTAAINSYNYFDYYNKKGPLYILIPKRPRHNGEKYQLHYIIDYTSTKLETDQYKDEEYLKFLGHEGFIDEDGKIDWKRVEDSGITYKEFISPKYDKAIKFLQDRLDSNSLWDSNIYDRMKDVRMLPFYMTLDMYRPGMDDSVYEILNRFETELSSKRLLKTSNGKWKIVN